MPFKQIIAWEFYCDGCGDPLLNHEFETVLFCNSKDDIGLYIDDEVQHGDWFEHEDKHYCNGHDCPGPDGHFYCYGGCCEWKPDSEKREWPGEEHAICADCLKDENQNRREMAETNDPSPRKPS